MSRQDPTVFHRTQVLGRANPAPHHSPRHLLPKWICPVPGCQWLAGRESRGQIHDSLARGRCMVAVDDLPPVLTHRLHLHPPTHSATASSAVTPLSLHPMPQPQKLPKSTAPCRWTLCCGDGSLPTWVSWGEGDLGLCLLGLLPVAFVPVFRVGRTVTSPLT